MEEFKTSVEMKKLKVEFGQAAFNKGFELYQEKMVMKFPELDLSFLDEASEDEAGPSTAAATAVHPPEVPSPSVDLEVQDLYLCILLLLQFFLFFLSLRSIQSIKLSFSLWMVFPLFSTLPSSSFLFFFPQ